MILKGFQKLLMVLTAANTSWRGEFLIEAAESIEEKGFSYFLFDNVILFNWYHMISE